MIQERKMVILHVASIKNELTTGVAAAVPQHINAQAKTEHVALLNVNNVDIDNVDLQFKYIGKFSLESFPTCFQNLDLVVFHNTYYIEFVKIAKTLKKNGIPYIIVPHGTLAQKAQRKKWLKKQIANFVFFDKFISDSSGIQFLSEHEMKCSKYRKKGFIGTNGVNVPNIIRCENYKSEINMVYIGRMEVNIKGLDMMICAVDQNRKLFADKRVRLNLYGPDYQGRHAEVLELIRKYNVSDYVFLHDAVVGSEKEKILLNTDIFIQTSRTEGMPMGILEALSYGIPCVVTKGTGVADVVSEYKAGWVADTSIQGIVNAMRDAICEKAIWNEKSERSRKLIADNYTWEKVASDALKEYKNIVRKSRE